MAEKCAVTKLNGTRVCSVHKQQLIELAVIGENSEGLGHLRSWVCPISNETLFDVEWP